MRNFIVIHRTLNADHRLEINARGWDCDAGRAYMRAERGNFIGAIEQGMMRVVALVEADHLETVFTMTNHIDRSWTENDGVLSVEDKVRSTSVGDIIYDDETGELHYVASFGFKPVANETSRAGIDALRSLVHDYKVKQRNEAPSNA